SPARAWAWRLLPWNRTPARASRAGCNSSPSKPKFRNLSPPYKARPGTGNKTPLLESKWHDAASNLSWHAAAECAAFASAPFPAPDLRSLKHSDGLVRRSLSAGVYFLSLPAADSPIAWADGTNTGAHNERVTSEPLEGRLWASMSEPRHNFSSTGNR